MSDHLRFAVDPWAVRETTLGLHVLGQTESVFALSNGHIGLRGNLDEGEPHERPGTYLTGFMSCGLCRTPRRDTATRSRARRSST